MGPVYAEVDIDAPREKIHDYLMDFATRRELYGNSVKQFRLVRIDSRGVGAGGRFYFGRGKGWADSSITAAEAGRISERGATGRYNRADSGTEWEIDETAQGITRVRLSYWTKPVGLARFTDRPFGRTGWHRRRLKRALKHLRQLMESDGQPTVEPVRVAGGKRYGVGVP